MCVCVYAGEGGWCLFNVTATFAVNFIVVPVVEGVGVKGRDATLLLSF